MRQRMLLMLGLLVCLGIGGLVLWSWVTAPAHRIDRRTFLRIRLGMKKQEVYDLVGGPPGNFSTGPTICVDGSVEHAVDPAAAAKVETWECDTDSIHVYFDDEGTVVGREWGEQVLRSDAGNPFAFVRGGLRHWLRKLLGD